MATNELSGYRDEAIDSAHKELFSIHGKAIGALVFFGDSAVAVMATIALWDFDRNALLVVWAISIILTSFMWEAFQRRHPEMSETTDGPRDFVAWIQTVVWAALPWLINNQLSNGKVVWVLVFVVTYGIATDLLFLSQTDARSLDVMVLAYGISYLVAFSTELQLLPMAAVLLMCGSSVLGGKAWSEVATELIHKRVASEERRRTDDLTGLATRNAAIENVQRLIDSGGEVHCAFIDVDDFKHLNDNHGYSVGDAVLVEVGKLLCAHLPASWIVARFGGDEFVAAGIEPASFEDLIEIEIQLRDHGGLEIAQSLSIGLATVLAGQSSVEDLFREAASALRFAKRLGKHQVLEITDELRMLEKTKLEVGDRVSTALESGEIMPWAQVIVDLSTGEAVGLELLARWEQPDGSMVPPEVFVPIIEHQGRGPALGLAMVTHAIEALASPCLRDRPDFLAVNLSARHLYHRRLPAEILALLVHHDVEAKRLILEITESQHLPSSPIWRDTANQLRTLGLGLAMDDFGSGYASLDQLLEVPFSHIKVDRVITQATWRPGAPELASAIAAMAKGAGMVTIVEGIETEEQWTAMSAAGCQLGQGFLFHAPESLADILAEEFTNVLESED